MSNSSNNKTVVVAMSGGVDSAVAASLLKDQGYNLIGITMKTWGYDDIPERDSGCCSLETIYSARSVADSLGFPHYTLDFTDRFNETVIDNLRLLNGARSSKKLNLSERITSPLVTMQN